MPHFTNVQVEKGIHPTIGWAVQTKLLTYMPGKVRVAGIIPTISSTEGSMTVVVMVEVILEFLD
jgi:hypothetical protein